MPDRHGPYRQLRFLVEIDGVAKAGFSRCSLPESRTQVVEYREGTDPPTPRKLWGLSRPTPLVLENGVTDDSMELFEWRQAAQRGDVDAARGPIAVVLLDETGQLGPRWELRNAWPARYEAPTLDAATSETAIERLVVVHEGMRRVPVEDDETAEDRAEAEDTTADEQPDGTGEDDDSRTKKPKTGWPTGGHRIPTEKRVDPFANVGSHHRIDSTDSTADRGKKSSRGEDPKSGRTKPDTDEASEKSK